MFSLTKCLYFKQLLDEIQALYGWHSLAHYVRSLAFHCVYYSPLQRKRTEATHILQPPTPLTHIFLSDTASVSTSVFYIIHTAMEKLLLVITTQENVSFINTGKMAGFIPSQNGCQTTYLPWH